MTPVELREYVQNLLTQRAGSQVLIEAVSHVGGGSINQTAALKTTAGQYFLKYNSASLYPQMFTLEERGLRLLDNTGSIHVPGVIGPGEIGEFSFLLLDYVDSAVPGKTFWEDFGSSLANLHKHTSDHFGLDHDNYIGSLNQSNHPHVEWHRFFIEERLEPQVQMANLPPDVEEMFNKLYTRLDEMMPVEDPALLHGDLWSGNYMASASGEPTLIDPAVYYGHREMDIAMTKLFGGFDGRFYSSYNAAYPMEKGWESRMDICNLYPLMVHVNLFGGSYLSQVNAILTKYTA